MWNTEDYWFFGYFNSPPVRLTSAHLFSWCLSIVFRKLIWFWLFIIRLSSNFRWSLSIHTHWMSPYTLEMNMTASRSHGISRSFFDHKTNNQRELCVRSVFILNFALSLYIFFSPVYSLALYMLLLCIWCLVFVAIVSYCCHYYYWHLHCSPLGSSNLTMLIRHHLVNHVIS